MQALRVHSCDYLEGTAMYTLTLFLFIVFSDASVALEHVEQELKTPQECKALAVTLGTEMIAETEAVAVRYYCVRELRT